jgi:hypothetical protein
VSRGKRGGIPTAVNLSSLDQSRYFFFQIGPHLCSRGWMDSVPNPLPLRKSGGAGNRTHDLWICSQELWPQDPPAYPCTFFPLVLCILTQSDLLLAASHFSSGGAPEIVVNLHLSHVVPFSLIALSNQDIMVRLYMISVLYIDISECLPLFTFWVFVNNAGRLSVTTVIPICPRRCPVKNTKTHLC